MKRIIIAFIAIVLLAFQGQVAFAQEDFDYIGKENMLLEYRVMKSTSPGSSTTNLGGVVSGFSGHSDNVGIVKFNTKTRIFYIGENIISYSEDDIRKVVYDDCILYTGRGFLTKGSGGEAPFQIKEFPDKTLYVNITWPSDFSASILECELKKVKELKPAKK